MGCIDKKISELVPLVVPAAGDLFAIVDISVPGFETKQITVANFLAALPAAPPDAQYVTLALDATLTNERVLTGTANQVIVTDGGAGGPVTLSTPQDIHILAVPQFDGLTLTGQLLIDGGVDEIQLVVQGDAAQTASLQEWQDSVGNTLIEILGNGDLKTDRWLDMDNNVFLGVDVAGASNLAHTAGSEGWYNSFVGNEAGYNITTGFGNIFINYQAGYANTTGWGNNFFGFRAGYTNIIGNGNVFVGYHAGYTNSTGSFNNFFGHQSGYSNTTSNYNFFLGYQAGYTNTIGAGNNFFGYQTGYFNLNGSYNSFIGFQAGYSNTSSSYNNFCGYQAGYRNQTGEANNFFGYLAGYTNSSGHYNNAFNYQAGYSLTSGRYNNFFGRDAGYTTSSGWSNNFFGYRAGYANSTGNYNNALGYQSGDSLTGSYNNFYGYRSGYSCTGSSNIFLGTYAGYNQAAISNLLIIDNQQRANAATEITNSIAYGVMAAAPANQTLRLNAKVGVRMTPVAQFDVIQPDNAAAIPVASFEQTDIDQVLWKIIGTAAAASADRTLVAASDFGTPGALMGWIQVNIQDDGNRLADADYWMPVYATPT